LRWRQLLKQSLIYHWRSHAGAFAGALLVSAILAGALLVGDSVDGSLRAIALARLGGTRQALYSPARFVSADLAEAIEEESGSPAAPVLHLRGMLIAEGEQLNNVQVLGVDERFFALTPDTEISISGMQIAINRKTADALRLGPGDPVSLRFMRPGLLSRDAPMASGGDAPIRRAFFTVGAILPETGIGRYSLAATQTAPYNAFVPLSWLQEASGMAGKCNTLLSRAENDLNPVLRKLWKPEHTGIRLHALDSGAALLESERIFLAEATARAALQIGGARGTLSYLVNGIAKDGKSTPYSFAVAGMGPADLEDTEIIVNQWLSDQIGAVPGDSISVSYYRFLPSNEYREETRVFQVNAVWPMDEMEAARRVIPGFPGLSDVEDCRNWDIGMPLEEEKLKDAENEAYWDAYRQTPKILVTREAGREMWANRFGEHTAIRFENGADRIEDIRDQLRNNIDTRNLGLYFMPVRKEALDAVNQALDFGGLFLGMSFFLIIAALILTAILFVFGIQQRAREMGILLAMGFTRRQVRLFFLGEAAAVALAGILAGLPCAILYTRALIFSLTRFWQGALANTSIRYHQQPGTFLTGAGVAWICALAAMALAARRQTRLPARELLTGDFASSAPRQPGHVFFWLLAALAGTAAATGASCRVLVSDIHNPAYPFFGIGALLLVSGICGWRFLIGWILRKPSARKLTLTGLALRNMTRRPGRSMSVTGLLACGAFLVFTVSSMRENIARNADQRSSGTGGYELYAETTIPLTETLAEFLEEYGASAVPIRLFEGDDASCLNLNHAPRPPLLGVPAAKLAEAGAFLPEAPAANWWTQLTETLDGDTLPAIAGDTDTAMWGLKAATGPEKGKILEYRNESGETVSVKLIGALPMRLSLFQGRVLTAGENFLRLFPNQEGYRVFLIDTPPQKLETVRKALVGEYEDYGMTVSPALDRLQEFYRVESTYLAMFLVLGGFGLALGGAGMGIVVLRNLLERRRETAMLQAAGFPEEKILFMLWIEHGILLAAALIIGILSAAVAMIPAIFLSETRVSPAGLAVILAIVTATSIVCTALAIFFSRNRATREALRNE
jgi:putative ABC transport system permease protein